MDHWTPQALREVFVSSRVAVVIPARMGSSRFPGKPLETLVGRPMSEHVFRGTSMSKLVHRVYIATCDTEIRFVAEGFGAPVVMTANTHERASDRVAEAAEKIDGDLIVLVQGDEPMVVTIPSPTLARIVSSPAPPTNC